MACIHYIDQLPKKSFCEIREELARGGLLTAFSIKTGLGWKYVDSPYEPRGEASRTVNKELDPSKPTILLGSGSGFFLRELVDRGFEKVFIITGSRELAERNIRRYDRRFGDSLDVDIYILATDNPDTAWLEVQKWLPASDKPQLIIHPREIRVFKNLLLTLQIRLLLQNKSFDKKEFPQKVLLSGTGGLFEHELIREFYRRGIEVEEKDRFAGNRITPEDAIRKIEKSGADLILSTNNLGSDTEGIIPEVCSQMGVKWATWLLDDPEFLVGLEERTGVGKERVGFCWDLNGEENWENLGFQNYMSLPLATDETVFSPGKGKSDLEGRLVFVGSPRFASSMGYFSRLDSDPEAGKISEMLLEEVIQSRKTPLVERVEILLKEEGLENHFEQDALHRLPAYIVQQANLIYRQELLNSLADLEPIVIGNGWEGLLDSRIELRESVDYYRELPKVYQSDVVHLSFTNLQMSYFPNQRPFDVGASGRVIVMDHLAGLKELFGEWIDVLVFKNKKDLHQKVEGLLGSKSDRQRYGKKLREIVLKSHTIRHRVEKMFNYLYGDQTQE